jgi:hypothetical protein
MLAPQYGLLDCSRTGYNVPLIFSGRELVRMDQGSSAKSEECFDIN